MRKTLLQNLTDEMAFQYENSGATHEENQHADGCDWIYDNCTCGMSEKDSIELW